MGFFSADMEPLLEVYQRETAELMEQYSACLVRLSRSGALSQTDINSVFRIVHTIKSSSAMIGMQTLSICTHRMEDLLLLFRDTPKRVIGNESRIADLMYSYSDYITAETAAMTAPGFAPRSADVLMRSIDDAIQAVSAEKPAAASETPAPPAPPTPPTPPEPSAEHQDSTGVTMKVLFSDDCKMVNVRAFQLVKQLKPLCERISAIPADYEKKQASEQLNKEGLILTVVSDRLDMICKLLNASPYVKTHQDIGDSKKKEEWEEAETARGDKTAKFGMVAWKNILAMQNVTGDLLTAYTLLQSTLAQKSLLKDTEGELLAIRKLLGELEDLVMAASMTPVSSIAAQYYRLIRDIAKNERKHVEFTLTGEELELDRSLLDTVSSALIHLLRNAVDHGIESEQERLTLGKKPGGRVTLSVEIFGGNARFTVSDDGRGMDPAVLLKKAKDKGLLTKPENEYTQQEAFSLIFTPGFSTSASVNQYSGRGVGMDVVQRTVDTLGGLVHIKSEVGKGSKFTLEVPITMSSTECIGFSVGTYFCMLPLKSIIRVYSYAEVEDKLKTIDDRLWLHDETMLPVIDLFSLYAQAADAERHVLVIHGMERTAAILTGAVSSELTAVEKPLPALLDSAYRSAYGISGCSVIGSGKLGLVLNAELLLRTLAGEGAPGK